MKPYLALIAFTMFLAGCNIGDEINALEANGDDRQKWVYIQFNTPEENNVIDSYWFFGKVSERLFNRIADNRVQSGFILMENVKYWGDDDLIHEFKDKQNTGELVFRIEDIRKMEGVVSEPITGQGYAQYEDETSSGPAGTPSSVPSEQPAEG